MWALVVLIVILITILFWHIYNERRWKNYVTLLIWCNSRRGHWMGRF